METAEFEKGLVRLMDEAETRRAAVMCAEAVHTSYSFVGGPPPHIPQRTPILPK